MEQSHFAIIYEDEDKAQVALQTLKRLHQLSRINLKKATVTVRYSDDEFAAQVFQEPSLVNPKYGLAGLAGTVVGVIGAAPLGPAVLVMGPVMGAVGTGAAIGLDRLRQNSAPDSLLSVTQANMSEHNSAIIVEVAIINLDITLKELAQLGSGTLVQYNLSPTFYQQLSEALAG